MLRGLVMQGMKEEGNEDEHMGSKSEREVMGWEGEDKDAQKCM